ncbi:MAG: hypothetical protein JWO70_924 [Betaproteobacteria bacterium]|jgi:hypothetical protein|nr:hypothetical protein [Betaproteobacteria bacterium]
MSPAVSVLALATLGLAACDVPQKKLETTALAARAAVPLAPIRGLFGARPAGADAQSGSAAAPVAAEGERSLRLYGPGVSRERQTGV